MKRKHLDSEPTPTAEPSLVDTDATFVSIDLDARLQRAIADLNFSHPTLVQAKAIPLALEGKDILARAKTGSGKTAAYLLPILHTALNDGSRALILVPTKELAEQVAKMSERLSAYCGKAVKTVNIAQNVSELVQRSMLAEKPAVVVATPSRAVAQVELLTDVKRLVVDEADLVLSYGYEDDLQGIAKALQKGLQTFLMSATLTKEVETLKTLFCRNPAILRLEEDEAEEKEGGVSQFVVKCAEDEKFLLTYVIFKLKLIKGKAITFVGDIDRCYRLKLFLEQFGIRSCVLNSELPLNSRLHIVDEFNKNVYDIIIATDENELLGDDGDPEDPPAPNTTEPPASSDAPKKKKRRKPRLDKEYGVSRGIDFHNVACVLNFDLPTTSKSYTHRIGRTARAGKTGMALSFVIPEALHGKHKPTSIPSTANDEKVLSKITKHQLKRNCTIKPYAFDMAQVASFRYRMEDALRAVTRTAIREARTRELRNELIASEKLKRHFEENPEDLRHLRHDGELRAARIQPHLRHVPAYLLPKNGAAAVGGVGNTGEVGLRKRTQNRIRKARMKGKAKGGGGGKGRDPLKVFGKKK